MKEILPFLPLSVYLCVSLLCILCLCYWKMEPNPYPKPIFHLSVRSQPFSHLAPAKIHSPALSNRPFLWNHSNLHTNTLVSSSLDPEPPSSLFATSLLPLLVILSAFIFCVYGYPVTSPSIFSHDSTQLVLSKVTNKFHFARSTS